jgi:hypothetical protein
MAAIELQDGASVAQIMDRIWQRDPGAKRHEQANLVIHEILQERAPSDSYTSGRPSAICVADGQLLVASRFDDLRQLVGNEFAPLGSSRVYRRLSRELDSISPSVSSFQFFAMRGDLLTPPHSFLVHRLAAVVGQEPVGPLLRGGSLSRGLYDNLGATTLTVRTTTGGWIAEGCSLQD